MYKISSFDNKLCQILRHHLDLVEENCGIYSIWSFCPMKRWQAIGDYFRDKPLCLTPWFPLVYWVVLSISIWGTFYSLAEFIALLRPQGKRISMWRPRKYYVLPQKVLRKCRLVGALVMLNAWLLQTYAVVSVSPIYMMPWLTINLVVLAFELFAWLLDIFVGTSRLKLQTIFSFAMSAVNYWFVRCVRNVFQRAIDINAERELRLWAI